MLVSKTCRLCATGTSNNPSRCVVPAVECMRALSYCYFCNWHSHSLFFCVLLRVFILSHDEHGSVSSDGIASNFGVSGLLFARFVLVLASAVHNVTVIGDREIHPSTRRHLIQSRMPPCLPLPRHELLSAFCFTPLLV